MLDNSKKICESCSKGNYRYCLKKKCVKNSTLKSLLGAYEGRYYRNKKVYTKKIGHIITPSIFYKNKFIFFYLKTKIVFLLFRALTKTLPPTR